MIVRDLEFMEFNFLVMYIRKGWVMLGFIYLVYDNVQFKLEVVIIFSMLCVLFFKMMLFYFYSIQSGWGWSCYLVV